MVEFLNKVDVNSSFYSMRLSGSIIEKCKRGMHNIVIYLLPLILTALLHVA